MNFIFSVDNLCLFGACSIQGESFLPSVQHYKKNKGKRRWRQEDKVEVQTAATKDPFIQRDLSLSPRNVSLPHCSCGQKKFQE